MRSNRRALRRLRQAALNEVFAHYNSLGLEYVDDVPLLVPITGACENVSTLYSLEGRRNLYLSQTGQLSLESELADVDGTYCVISSFRADEPDKRHLNEFRLVEEEFAWTNVAGDQPYDPHVLLTRLLERARLAVTALMRGALTQPGAFAAFGASTEPVERAVAADQWPIVTYREGLELLERSGRFGPLDFGLDLGPQHETALIELVAAERGVQPMPVFITHFPEWIKFFNMKIDPSDPQVVLSADLLLPVAGEALGSAVREDHFPTLRRRLAESSMLAQLNESGRNSLQDFDRYLRLIESGCVPPHAGYGIGLERVLQFILSQEDVRVVSGTHQLTRELSREFAMT
jgi:asparaginyl-tRNA synthetase